MREVRYQSIADDLRRRVECPASSPPAGCCRARPSLARAYDASRVTVRKALEVLRDDGLVDVPPGLRLVRRRRSRCARRSAGSARSKASSRRLGVAAERRILDFGFVQAPRRVRAVLGAERGAAGAPPQPAPTATRSPASPCGCRRSFGRRPVTRRRSSARPFYELLPVELGGATQTIGAAAATADDAALLGDPRRLAGAAVRTRHPRPWRGTRCSCSEHVFPAHRTEFVVELPSSARRWHRPASASSLLPRLRPRLEGGDLVHLDSAFADRAAAGALAHRVLARVVAADVGGGVPMPGEAAGVPSFVRGDAPRVVPRRRRRAGAGVPRVVAVEHHRERVVIAARLIAVIRHGERRRLFGDDVPPHAVALVRLRARLRKFG